MPTITIQNLRHIKRLAFEIPGSGVHLLAGPNGAGKTSVLACLRRIGAPNAFALHFQSSQIADSLDNFGGASIQYRHDDGREVTYTYRRERWAPSPRSNSALLEELGYRAVLYIGATADRITPRPDDFSLRRIRPAREEIREAANSIFGTNRFDSLRTINLTRGAGNQAFVLQAPSSTTARHRYFSEKNFSLGELCVLKLVKLLTTCARESLVLIDELELALHPRAQVELVKYLERIASEKDLTIIFSTHSSSLLKRIPRNRILYLQNDEGNVSTVKGCYPTYALGNMAYEEESAPDVVIYVEDDAALHIVDALQKLSIKAIFADQLSLYPTVSVVPIGPFIQVVRFLSRSDALLPPSTKTAILLDQDVQSETMANWRRSGNHARLAEFQAHEQRLRYLPWAPEVGVVDFARENTAQAEAALRAHFGDNRISLNRTAFGLGNAVGSARRGAAKAVLASVCEGIARRVNGVDEHGVEKALFEAFARWYFANNRDAALALLGPILRA